MGPQAGSRRALIIGAGIAGPALALAMRRAGVDSLVLEANPLPRDQAGAFINLPPNGLHALRTLALDRRIDGLGFEHDHLVFRTETGRVLAQVAVGGILLLRGTLSRVLREAAEQSGIGFEFDRRIRAVEQQNGTVVAECADGTAAIASMLIGADGIHSGTRHDFFPEAPQPRYTGLVTLGGILTTDLPSTGGGVHMIFGHHAFFAYGVRPSGETFWFSNARQREEPPHGSLDAIDLSEWRERLFEIHRDDPPEVLRILRGVRHDIGAYPVYELAPLARWHRGRVCLVGDAAHAIGPQTGQGAALALEDALVLAKCVRDLPDTGSAFAAFEALRRERVERVARQSRRAGRQRAPAGALSRKVRDWILPLFLRRDAQTTQQLHAFEFDWDTPVEYGARTATRG